MSKLDGYSSNGSVHLITNNLIGFTAQAGAQCSSFTAGDIGKYSPADCCTKYSNLLMRSGKMYCFSEKR